MYLIYMHINKINGKKYIGKTAQTNNPNRRWKNGFGYPAETQPIFYNAIQKYGWNNFEHKIIEENIKSAKEANEREKYWINYYHSWVLDPECNGYNITQGGDGNKGHIVSEEAKEKIRQARLHQKNLSLDHNKGKKYYNNGTITRLFFPGQQPNGFIEGRLLSNEAREKISKAMSINNTNRKGKLKKICIIKDNIIKCIGEKNLNKYLKQGWSVYNKKIKKEKI